MRDEQITATIISKALRVHSLLGPGLLESAYRTCLAHELLKSGVKLQLEVPVRLDYDGISMEMGYRIDLLVENEVIVELKAVEKVLPVHRAQVLSYLRLSNLRTGLLINFNVPRLRDGIQRIAN